MNRTPCIDDTFLPRGPSRGWDTTTTAEVALMRAGWRGNGVLGQVKAQLVPALGGSCGKCVPGQSTALHLRVGREAPTALRCSVSRPRRSTHCAYCVRYVQTSATGQITKRAARAAASPVLLGAPQARRRLSWHAFAVAFALRNKREEAARQAVPAGGDLWSDEDRRTGVGARSALRRLTRRNCLSAVSKANAASSATRPLAENRSAVGANRRPRNHEPPAGTAWRDAEALVTCACLRITSHSNPKAQEQELREPHASPAADRSA